MNCGSPTRHIFVTSLNARSAYPHRPSPRYLEFPIAPWCGRSIIVRDFRDIDDWKLIVCSRQSAGFQALLAGWVLCDIEPMKSLTEHLWFEVPNRRGFVNITSTVENLVRKSGVQEGLCLVNAMHITASVFINDNESGLLHDYEVWLERLAPHAPTTQYEHNRTGEDNADAHLKRQVMGREVVVAITKGKLDFGPWEQIFYGEFDGRRRKRALVKIIGE